MLLGLSIDVITKQLAVRYLDPANPPVLLGGLLRLQLIRNPGAAFSLGSGVTPLFTTLSLVVLIFVLAVLVPRLGHPGWAVALGLLAAGIAGNLSDRLFREPGFYHGHVVDFLQLPHWAIFNVADMCVVSAAILIVILSIFRNVSISGEKYPTKAEQQARQDQPSHDDQTEDRVEDQDPSDVRRPETQGDR
jgi:signal peptidase II